MWNTSAMITTFQFGRLAPILVSGLFAAFIARADCTLTNSGVLPLGEMGFATYLTNKGGLYPNGLNTRPLAHELAGIAIAMAIQPLETNGVVNTNTGKIGLLSIGMSNVTQEWAVGGTNHFTSMATNDPSLNPRLVIADGGISGQDAVDWTNLLSTNWTWVSTQRLASVNLTTNQVQVIWMKQAIQFAGTNGPFPAHARLLQSMTEQIVRNAKVMFPNLKIAYLASRTRAYTNSAVAPNPEPYAFESGFSVRWVIEDQIMATNNLNYAIASGPVVAPWLSWGPYFWVDGVVPRGDGLTWLCSDVNNSDFMHPSPNGGVPKVAAQLLSFFKTDPTATPWFLRKPGPGAPTCAPTASVTNGYRPLTVNFFANAVPGSAPLRDAKWTFEDGQFATNLNPVKIFRTPGTYHPRFTVTDTNGNTAQGSVTVKVNAKFSDWIASKFTATERLDLSISGTSATPDGDKFPNLLEYAMGLEPKDPDPTSVVTTTLTNDLFTLTYPHYKYAADAPLTLETTTDFITWDPVSVTQSEDLDPIEYLTVQQSITTNAPRFFRFRSQFQNTGQ